MRNSSVVNFFILKKIFPFETIFIEQMIVFGSNQVDSGTWGRYLLEKGYSDRGEREGCSLNHKREKGEVWVFHER